MPRPAHMQVRSVAGWWVAVCSIHGQLTTHWGADYLAQFDALGHVAHFHTSHTPAYRG